VARRNGAKTKTILTIDPLNIMPASTNPLPEPESHPPLTVASSGSEAESRKPEPERAAQARKISDLIGTGQQIVLVMNEDAVIRTALSRKSFDTQKIELGRALSATLDQRYQDRQRAMSAQTQATAVVTDLFAEEMAHFIDFRETARTIYTSKADRQALSLSGRVPQEVQQFIIFARAGYTAAQGEKYTAELTKYDYPPATLDERLAALPALLDADQDQVRAIQEARASTRVRDEAARPLRAWVSQARRIARRVFRKQPEQARKLDF
jgi:hypothetical protein